MFQNRQKIPERVLQLQDSNIISAASHIPLKYKKKIFINILLVPGAALDSITEDGEEAPPDVLTYGGKKYKSVRPKSLASDALAQEAVNLLRASGGHGEVGSSPGDLVPPNVEPGSLVILSGAPPKRELRAFIVQLVEGKPRLCPANLPADVIKTIAAQVGVTPTPDPA